MAALTVVRDLREHWRPASAEELEQFETDPLSGFVLARASAGLADGTIRGDVGHLDQIRSWFGRPLWDMEPADADAYFGKMLRGSPSGTRLARSQALTTYFMFLELRHKVEIHRMTGRVVECPIDEMNRPRGTSSASTLGYGRSGPGKNEIAVGSAGIQVLIHPRPRSSMTETPPELVDFCTSRANGTYAHPTDPSLFIKCSNGYCYECDCPDGMTYDEATGGFVAR
ncbi:carbohydrate-binding module family 14 protein [Streptomyces sp. NBC_00203]|uniref:carbohydrate-binding module family 14 protein n=1 Tax=Streptomyces sp. NBC_00203 TaxID=2975680 RepID=UPI00324BE277